MTKKFKNHLKLLGHSLYNCPFTPLHKDWENFPIVKAIRATEKATGKTYVQNSYDP